jgi:aspartyl-tRNA(Asn)/glutamyl-tRNA(Gln) amidotransferase subunit B
MEEGSMRVDANVSVRRSDADAFGTRCEIKNLNSLRSVARAIDYEAERQVGLLESGGRVVQETRHWDEGAGRTVAMRSKEEAYDYRYFPEPDLVPLAPDAAWQAEVEDSLPLLPADRRARLVALFDNLTPAQHDQVLAVVDQQLDELVLSAAAVVPATLALARTANEVGADPGAGRRLDPVAYRALLAMEDTGALSATQAKTVLAELLARGAGDPQAIAGELGFEAMSSDSLASVVDEAVAAHPEEWSRYLAGDEKDEKKLTGFFTGLIMKATRGQADGKAVAVELRRRKG